MQVRHSFAGVAFVLLPALYGCTPLPDVAALVASSAGSAKMPALIDAHGPVSQEQQQQLLQGLWSAQLDSGMLARHLPVAAAISTAPLVAGNRATLLVDGPAIEHAIMQAVAGAKNHINIETYIIADDEVGRRFADLLIKKRAEQVPVTLMYDSFASRRTPKSFFDRLKKSGVRLLEFNPINPFDARLDWAPNHRDHRKVFIVDGSIAIIGGANIEHPRAVEGETYWRDTDITLEGPIVAQIQTLFMRTWNEQGGEPLADADYFPKLTDVGDQVIRVLGGTARESPIYGTLVSAILAAQKYVYLTTPYFVPDAELLAAIKGAAQRGVHVRLVLPSFSDFPPALAAARFRYQELLESGVEIYERQHAWLHAKTAVIDGVWSTVGSTNLDRRSFLFNREVNAVMLGRDFAQRMERAFEQDRAASAQITAHEWQRRSVRERLEEWGANLFSYWW